MTDVLTIKKLADELVLLSVINNSQVSTILPTLAARSGGVHLLAYHDIARLSQLCLTPEINDKPTFDPGFS